MANFKDIGVNKELLKSIREMGFEAPTPIQKESIPYLLTSHQDLISLAQTVQVKQLLLDYLLFNRQIQK